MIFYESPVLSILFLAVFVVGLHVALKSEVPPR